MNIKIKDPVSEKLIPYPLPVTSNEPRAKGRGKNDSIWIEDKNPQLKPSIILLNNMLNNDADIPCDLFIDNLKPNSNAYSVALTNLKSQKMY